MSYNALNLPDQVRGDTWNISIYFQDQNEQPININGRQYWFTIKNVITDSDEDAVIQVGPLLPPANDAVLGLMRFTVPPSVTEDIVTKSYYYDIQEVTPDGVVTTVLIGKVKIQRDVTLNTTYAATPTPEYTTTSGLGIFQGDTSNTDPNTIYIDGIENAVLGVKVSSILAFNALVVGKDTVTQEACAFELSGAVERDSADTLKIIGTVGKTILGRDSEAFDANLKLIDVNNSIGIEVVAANSNFTTWSARLEYTEVFV